MNVADVLVRALGALIGCSIAAWFVLISVDLASGFARFGRRSAGKSPGKEERRD